MLARRLGLVVQSAWHLAHVAAWATQQGLRVVAQAGLLVHVEADPDLLALALGGVGGPDWHREQDWHWSGPLRKPPGVVAVTGLSARGRVHPHVQWQSPPPITDPPGPGPGYHPQQLWAAYGCAGAAEDGTGQVIGIAEWGVGFQQSDLDQFCQDMGLPPVTPQVVNVGGTALSFDPSQGPEATLDIAWAHAMAPGAQIRVYQHAGASDIQSFAAGVSEVLNAVLTDSVTPCCLSISYGDGEDSFHPEDLQAWEHLIAALAAKGITVFVSAGDQGAYGHHVPGLQQVPRVEAPASCPSAVAVGGTSLYMNLTTFEDERVWSNRYNAGATGGGYSAVFTTPAYQTALHLASRGVPDVAAVADPWTPAYLRFNGQPVIIGGTSLAAPVVAGIWARIAQARHAAGLPPLGDPHALLYQHGAQICRDIVEGTNTCFATTGYPASPGWDACTGWGSPLYTQWKTVFATAASPPSPVDPKTLTVRQLADAPDGQFGASWIPLQQAARTVMAAAQAIGQNALAAFAEHPVGYYDAIQRAAAQLWIAGVRS
ncbi:MAG: S53 family peptidase [Actinomycetia bacterium]|nr:S53 family peptidase [Actinomycetes bacterium]